MKKLTLIGTTCLLAGVASADVAGLEALQQATGAHQYTFEGTYNAADGTGSWLDNKIATPDLIQDGFEDPSRIAEQTNPGYDSSSSYADFQAWSSGGKGDGLKSAAPITYATSGSIEYMVQFGATDNNNFMISGVGTGANARLRPLSADGTKAQMTMGSNSPHDLIGGATGVGYTVGDWYYVAQIWSISGGNVSMDAWVANMSDATPTLTKTINGASNVFDGDTTTTLYLGSVNGSQDFMAGGLDAIAIYDTQLSESTITSHFNVIPEPEALGLVAIGFAGLLVVRRFHI